MITTTLPTDAQLDVEFFRSLAHEMRTQDNACTADPYVLVEEEVTDYGFNEEYGGEPVWLTDDGDSYPASPTKAKRLEFIYQQTGETREGWTRVFGRSRWEFRQAFMTVKAARAFIDRQRHNHGKLRVYIKSACRNPEMRKLREQLLLLGATSSSDTLPTLPAQYLFLRPDGELELWKLTTHGWFASDGTHYDSPLERNPGLTQWGRARL